MGTYLHAFIEVDRASGGAPFTDASQICSLAEGSFCFGKDYEVFDALGAGRMSVLPIDDREALMSPLIAPRGMPSPCSLEVAQSYYRLIADQDSLPDEYFWSPHRCISVSTATQLISEARCEEAEVRQSINCPPQGIRWRVVSEPEWYNASWLNLEEFDASLLHYGLKLAELPVEYRAIRTVMSLYADDRGCDRVRLVFWFS